MEYNIAVDFDTKKIFVNNKEYKLHNEDPKVLLSKNGLELKNIGNKTLELCLIAVEQNGKALQFVPSELQTPEICMKALKDKNNLQYVINNKKFFEAFINTSQYRKFIESVDTSAQITEEAQIMDVVKRNGLFLQCVKDPTPEICMEAVKENGRALQFVKNQTPEICMEAVKKYSMALQFVKDPTPEIYMGAVKRNGMALQFVKDQTLEICMEAVKENGMSLQFVKDQKIEICMEAVKENGMSLQFVKDQTPEICIEAIKRCYGALQFVKDQTLEICMEAIKQNAGAFKFVKDQSHEMCMKAVEQNGDVLQYVENQTPEMCMKAVEQNGWALSHVKVPTEELCYQAVKDDIGIFRFLRKEFHTPKIVSYAVKKDSFQLQYAQSNVTLEICINAFNQNPESICFMSHIDYLFK